MIGNLYAAATVYPAVVGKTQDQQNAHNSQYNRRSNLNSLWYNTRYDSSLQSIVCHAHQISRLNCHIVDARSIEDMLEIAFIALFDIAIIQVPGKRKTNERKGTKKGETQKQKKWKGGKREK